MSSEIPHPYGWEDHSITGWPVVRGPYLSIGLGPNSARAANHRAEELNTAFKAGWEAGVKFELATERAAREAAEAVMLEWFDALVHRGMVVEDPKAQWEATRLSMERADAAEKRLKEFARTLLRSARANQAKK